MRSASCASYNVRRGHAPVPAEAREDDATSLCGARGMSLAGLLRASVESTMIQETIHKAATMGEATR